MNEYQREKAFRTTEKIYRKQHNKIIHSGVDTLYILQLLAGVLSGRPYNGNVVFPISVFIWHLLLHNCIPSGYSCPAVDKSQKRDQEERSNAG